GGNVDKAVAAYEEKFGTRLDATNSQALAEELDSTGGPAIVSYTITEKDIAGPYVASIPDDYAEKALLPAMAYTRVSEMLGERFHMDENYLKAINPGADFNRPGTILKVTAVGANVTEPVARIIADKGREQVRAYDATGRLVAAYPSTIGSSDTPSPSGTVEVSRIAFDPNYTYNPKINFTQGSNKSILTIPPGPNGPVGSVWIALSKPTYGIHGTPEPSKIGKTNSHGCVRLANFDAQELAKLVKPGVTVEFIE
ncbi:MAG: L,D-transpeptidase, partial [Brevundimonas sp.]